MDHPTGREAGHEAASASIRQLRSRLLDLTARNPLVSFPHGRPSGGRVHVRAIDGHVDALFAHLAEGKQLVIRPLPPIADEPKDEGAPAFQAELKRARVVDETYAAELANLPVDELASAKAASVERNLRDRVRASLGMPRVKAAVQAGLADHAASLGLDADFDLRASPTAARARERAIEFQAMALQDALERQLAKIRDTARTVAEETGVSTLHLALGFLEWFESDASDRPITSPLVLMRVDIERQIVRSRYQYALCSAGDDAEVNLTLSERLDRDFRIKLPGLIEDETPEIYLARVRDEVCKGRRRWSVRRYVTLAHFPFARLAMFQDLDESVWPEGLAAHAVLGPLLGGKDSGPSMFAEEHDVDSPAVSEKVPILVMDADASQHSAVYDAMSGKDLVIEGPPGTGKSQTITNIIAAALSNGKRVLFVADKQAALQVVKDRLDNVGLGDFCLELHSGKARKTDLLASLDGRLARRQAPVRIQALDDKLSELTATRAALTKYVEILNHPFGRLGLTIHEILWADRRRRDREGPEARRLDAVELPSCETLTHAEVEARAAVLDRFELAASSILAGFGSIDEHPWRSVTRVDLPSVDVELAARAAEDAASAMAAAARAAEALHPFGVSEGATLDGLRGIASTIASMEVDTTIPATWLPALAPADARSAAREWLQACHRYRRAMEAQSARILLPDGCDPRDVSLRIAGALSAAGASLPAECVMNALPSLAAESHAESLELAQLVNVADALVAALAIEPLHDLGDLALAATAATLATELSNAELEVMTPELMAGAVAVEAASAVIATAKAVKAELERDYSLPPGLEPDILRGHAAALAASGIFGFLNPTVKAARLCFAGLSRLPRPPGKASMARALMVLAEHIEEVRAIDANKALRRALGDGLDGLATDLVPALGAIAWTERVRAALPIDKVVGATLRSALLSGDGFRLQAIRKIAKNPGIAALSSALGRYPAAAKSFAELANRASDRSRRISTLAAICSAVGVPGDTPTAALHDIVALLEATGEAAEAARPPARLAAALDGTCPEPLDNHDKVKAALVLADGIAHLALPSAVLASLQSASPATLRDVVVPAATALSGALAEASTCWKLTEPWLMLDEQRLFGRTIGLSTPSAAAAKLASAASHPGDLAGWILYLKERHAAEALGQGALVRLWDECPPPCALSQAFDRVFHRALARAAFRAHPELERFTGLGQDEARRRFASLDTQATALRRQHLADDLGRRPIPAGIGVGRSGDRTDTALILHEIGKKKRHVPIRQLMDRAGDAIQALKPCFMMSPLSVAQYLKPDRLCFDMLVIDEASQMRPEDAIGSVARCGQIVVVGDPKQLPPTSFFARGDDPDAEPEDGFEEVDAESILDLAQGVFRPMRRLRWHYRSRHGSLIAFSNKEFYDGDLMVFPSPAPADDEQGVASVKVDGIYAARSNQAEVEALCAAALHHMRTRPGRSLGIATMNQVQRELISLEMDRLATIHPEVEAFREQWAGTLERFFVKNLENVQGDERDFIFISTVFGPTAPGGRVRQVFGPINGASGHRRLNVLFTRAKHHLRLFTSMEPDDVTASTDSPRGAQVLKAYLAYARTGRLEAGFETGREADSDFEVFVRERLRLSGYDAVPQVGVAGYFIDLAVRDPASPATFLLGIECDGASYHSSRSARDRDILRQQVLEGLGWTIYRIWSTDWFRDPEGQTKKLVSFIGAHVQSQGRKNIV